MTIDEQFMRRALELAERAWFLGEVPVGAVIVRDGTILAEGYNLRETAKNALRHAELDAIDAACRTLGGWRLPRCTLYVTLEPCPMCAGAIVMAGIDAVFFGAYDPRCGCAGSLYDLPEDASFGRVIPCSGGLLEAECRLALNAFFDLRRG